MINKIPSSFQISSEVARALATNDPIVALESTVITHGLPYPENLQFARDAQELVKSQLSIPATTSLLNGKLLVGMEENQLNDLVNTPDLIKISSRNIGIGVAQKRSGGTTVAGTLVICRTVGMKVFATGGIGGVHRGSAFDTSADLDELAHSPVIVVCSGAKSILDLPATLEALETRGVPVIGYQTEEFPAFYSVKSGLPVDCSVNSVEEVALISASHRELGLHSAILVCVPPPSEFALDSQEVEKAIREATKQADRDGVTGPQLTPYLLEKVNELTHGKSLQTNLALLKNNISIASQIALHLSHQTRLKTY
jgi:pseudouridine-5'-phosphate glycosidase